MRVSAPKQCGSYPPAVFDSRDFNRKVGAWFPFGLFLARARGIDLRAGLAAADIPREVFIGGSPLILLFAVNRLLSKRDNDVGHTESKPMRTGGTPHALELLFWYCIH